jgi:hypothetical protein
MDEDPFWEMEISLRTAKNGAFDIHVKSVKIVRVLVILDVSQRPSVGSSLSLATICEINRIRA